MKSLALYGALAATLVACSKKQETPRVEERTDKLVEAPPGASRVPGDPFLYADARVITAPVPARFTAPLPTTLAGFRDDAGRHPPQTATRALACGGDAATLDKLTVALRTVAERGPIEPELAGAYRGYFDYCSRPEACDWLAGYLTSDEPRAARQAMWPALKSCGAPKYAAVVVHADATDAAVIEWYWDRSLATIFGTQSTAPFHARLVDAARATIANGSEYDVRKLGMIFASLAGERAMPAFYELYEATKDPARRARMAVGLGDLSDRKAKQLFARACKHPDVSKDALCRGDDAAAPRAEPTIDEKVEGYRVDVAAWIERDPARRPAILDALARCAGAADKASSTRARCLAHLAGVDRPRALAVAGSLDLTDARDQPWWNGELEAAVASLAAHPEPGSLAKQLAAWGMLGDDAAVPAHALTARDILEQSGRVHAFDVETGMFPNEHDALLGELATLAGPALDGVVFEEVPPRDYDAGSYTLHAYMDGKRYSIGADNHGDWYDMTAVLGLLNLLAEARGSEIRFVPLPTGDQTAAILASPRDAIAAAVTANLLLLDRASAGMDSGKAFEQYARERLQADPNIEVLR